MDNDDCIQGDEELYRNVRGGLENEEYVCDDDGILRILPEAFGDTSPSKNPSVDRAKKLDFKPERALLPKRPSQKRNGIVSIKAVDVRSITNVKTETEDGTVRHAIDVVFDPSKHRPAHSLITVDPEFIGSRRTKRETFGDLQKALASRASRYGWTLEPEK